VTVLGIETATAVCGVALARNGAIVAERRIEQRYAHAETLFGFLDDVLEKAGAGLRDVQCLAVSIGPGSFTGLRIGLSVVKGLHMATDIPVVAVPTLEALARNARAEAVEAGAGSILTVLDARRDEVYWQLFALDFRGVSQLSDVRDGHAGDIAPLLPPGRVAVVGEALQHVSEVLQGSGVDPSRLVTLSAPSARCSAAAVAMLGAELYGAGSIADIAILEPRYIKEFFLRTPE